MPKASENLIFGIDCPHCGYPHLLSALGVRPIAEDAAEEPLEPSLAMLDPEEVAQNGVVPYIRARCQPCGGLFDLDVTLVPVVSVKRRGLSLVKSGE